jgi:hypothetical protein
MPSAPSVRRSVLTVFVLLAALPSSAQQPPSSTCLIKGNISNSGERIYHPPGCKYYAATVIDLKRGERRFCSEAEAVAAGWRRTKVC